MSFAKRYKCILSLIVSEVSLFLKSEYFLIFSLALVIHVETQMAVFFTWRVQVVFLKFYFKAFGSYFLQLKNGEKRLVLIRILCLFCFPKVKNICHNITLISISDILL